MKSVLGIDPGLSGGFAILDGDSVIVEPMPLTEEGKLDLPELVRLLSFYAPTLTRAYLERVGAMPGNGSVSMFSFGRSFGALEGVLTALGINYELVTPRVWSKEYDHGITEDEDRGKRQRLIKAARREIVARLYPGIDLKRTERSQLADEGMVDALLIADYGWQLNNKGDPTHEQETA